MRTIYKYPLVRGANNVIALPSLAKPLCIQNQRGVPCLWVEVETLEKRKEEWVVYSVGAGYECPHPSVPYLGTSQFGDGELVLHYYIETMKARRSRKDDLDDIDG